VDSEVIFKLVTDSCPHHLDRPLKQRYRCVKTRPFKTTESILAAAKPSKRYDVVTDVKRKRGFLPLFDIDEQA
jgi:hypothetical protein